MSNFEERLLTALKEDIVAGSPAIQPVRHRRRFVGLAAAVTGVAAATTVVALLYGGATSPAFAVTKGGDGTIEVQINDLTDPDELAAALKASGVNAVVDYLPAGQTCKPGRGESGIGDGGKVMSGVASSGTGSKFFISEGMVGKGETLVLAVSGDNSGDGPFAMSIEVVKGAVAPCEPVAMPTPSGPGKGTDNGPTTTEKQDNGPTFEKGGPSTDVGGQNS